MPERKQDELAHTKEYAPKFEPTARARTAPYSVRDETFGSVACHCCNTPTERQRTGDRLFFRRLLTRKEHGGTNVSPKDLTHVISCSKTPIEAYMT
jgi:hypothetical protein